MANPSIIMADPTFEEIQRILNDDDIEKLTRGILFTLKDMSDSKVENDLKISQIYDRMGLNAYHRKVVDYICQNYLLPNGLIKLQDDKIQITDKGLNRIKQIEKTDAFLYKETLNKLERSHAEYSQTSNTDQIKRSSAHSHPLDALRLNLEKLSRKVESIDYIDAVTVKGSDGLLRTSPKDLDISNLKNIQGDVIYRTRIELDGDIVLMVPRNEDKVVDKEILNLHKENVKFNLDLWTEMVNTISKMLKDFLNNEYSQPIGDGENMIGNVHNYGFEIDLSRMETGKKYPFQFEEASYSVMKNEKGELDVYETSDLST